MIYSCYPTCSLEEGGQTALGPALLVSISIAARVPGSKVYTVFHVHCTCVCVCSVCMCMHVYVCICTC